MARESVPIGAALPGVIVGCVLYLAGGVVGPRIGPGWADVIQGSAFFVGLIGAVLGVRRAQRLKK
jgi:hypothetical protein